VTGLIVILLLGTLVLISGARLLVQWARTRHAAVVSIEDYSGARAVLDSLVTETAAVKRIFARDDVEFISQNAAPEVKVFFVSERKVLAIRWLRMTQKQVRELMDLHLKLASYTYEPSPRSEMKLTVNYLCFILASKGLLVLLWLFGPFEVVRIAAYTVRVAEYFCSVFSLRLEKIDPVNLGSARQPRSV